MGMSVFSRTMETRDGKRRRRLFPKEKAAFCAAARAGSDVKRL